MNNKQVAREMLKDFQVKVMASQRSGRCPFILREDDSVTEYDHSLCAVLFPRWRLKYLDKNFDWLPDENGIRDPNCPCEIMTHSYVRRKARRFVKEGK